MAVLNASSKYKDIISKCTLITSGRPTVYELRPKEEKFENFTRKIVGEKKENKMNKTILLVGETGGGKTTLINALINYAMGVTFEDQIWFKIIDEGKRSQCKSQTSDVIVYEVFGFKDKTLPYSLTIIDTPGYGSTEGIEQDALINRRLLELFRSDDGVHQIDAVGLVLKDNVNRLTDQQKYTFDSVLSLFGKDMEKNIVALITHSMGLRPTNALEALEAADIKCAKNEKNQPVYFLFNNCQTRDRTEEEEDLKYIDGISVKGMKQFSGFLTKSEPQNLNETVKVLNLRERLPACIQNLQERIKLIELKQGIIKKNQETVKKYEQEMKNNKDFTVEVEEDFKVTETYNGRGWWFMGWFHDGVTRCTVCEENCHSPGCTHARTAAGCQVMVNGSCTSCSGKCPVSKHVKDQKRYITKTREVQKTQEDMKQKYEKNKAAHEEEKGLLENLQIEIEELKAEKIKLLDEAYQHVVTLAEIALNTFPLSTYVQMDLLIEKMKETRDMEKIQNLEEIKRQGDKNPVPDTLQYMFSRAAAGAAKDAVRGAAGAAKGAVRGAAGAAKGAVRGAAGAAKDAWTYVWPSGTRR